MFRVHDGHCLHGHKHLNRVIKFMQTTPEKLDKKTDRQRKQAHFGQCLHLQYFYNFYKSISEITFSCCFSCELWRSIGSDFLYRKRRVAGASKKFGTGKHSRKWRCLQDFWSSQCLQRDWECPRQKIHCEFWWNRPSHSEQSIRREADLTVLKTFWNAPCLSLKLCLLQWSFRRTQDSRIRRL